MNTTFDNHDRMAEQVAQLDDPIDRLWWFAQMERGIEVADIDREPKIGSATVLDYIAQEGSYNVKKESGLSGARPRRLSVEVTIGDVK